MAKIGRPRKKKGTRVVDQLHVGLRLPDPIGTMFRLLVDKINLDAGAPEFDCETISSLTRTWIAERIRAEWQKHATPVMRDEVERSTGFTVSADGRYVSVVTAHPTLGHRVHEFAKMPMEVAAMSVEPEVRRVRRAKKARRP